MPRLTPPLAAVPVAAPHEPARPGPSGTPLALATVPVPRPPSRPSRDRGWTLMLVPPPRAVARVRSVIVRRWHVVLPLLLLTVVLVAVTLGAAHVAAWVFDTRVAPEVAALRDRLESAERDLGVLSDSLARVSVKAEAVLSVREAAAAAAAASSARARSAPSSGRRGFALGAALPVNGRVTSRFAPRRMHPVLMINRPHRGLDIAAPSGTPVRAPADGRVTRVAREFGYGLVVFIDHGGGVTSRYAHLRSAQVTNGQRVTASTRIGTVGSSGLATAPHLHYEVRVRGQAVDPLRTLPARR